MVSHDEERSLKPGRPRVERMPRPSSMAFDEVAETIKAIPAARRPGVREAALKAAASDGSLTGASFRVFHTLVWALRWRDGVARVSSGWLSSELGLNRRTITKCLKLIVAGGHLLRRHRRRDSDLCEVAENTFPTIAQAHAQAEAGAAGVGAENLGAENLGARRPQGRGQAAPRVGARRPQGRGQAAPQSHESVPCLKSRDSHESRARARGDGTDLDSPRADQGLTAPAEGAQPQTAGLAHLVGDEGSAGGPLPAEWPFGLHSELAEKVRRRGIEPQPVWDRIVSRNAERIRRRKGPLQVDNWDAYIIATAERMARERLGPANPSALAQFRALRGPAWKPNGRGGQ